MKKILMLVVALMALGSVDLEAQGRMELKDLVLRGDTFLDASSLRPYTGDVVMYHLGSNVVRRWGTLKNGKWDGTRESYLDDGQLQFRIQYEEGVMQGLYEFFLNGELTLSGNHHQGEKCGEWLSWRNSQYPPCPSN